VDLASGELGLISYLKKTGGISCFYIVFAEFQKLFSSFSLYKKTTTTKPNNKTKNKMMI